MRFLVLLAVVGTLAEVGMATGPAQEAMSAVHERQAVAVDRLVCQGRAKEAVESGEPAALARAEAACREAAAHGR
jgi:malonyl CoA-acyl carrier protein transacylase